MLSSYAEKWREGTRHPRPPPIDARACHVTELLSEFRLRSFLSSLCLHSITILTTINFALNYFEQYDVVVTLNLPVVA